MGPVTLLRKLDREIRVAIKEILHLPACTVDGLLYASKKDGGLGIPRLETVVISSSLKSGLRYLSSPDAAIRALALASGLPDRLRRSANAVRMNWPVDATAIEKWKRSAKKRELESWGESVAQGKAVRAHTNDPIGNAWLYNPALLRPSRYLTALRLRTDQGATRVAMHRANPQPDILCRKCRARPETLAHVLGQCTFNKKERIRRHDEIVDLVMNTAISKDPEAVVLKEPRLEEGVVLKPDLVIVSRGGVRVVDVTVRHEDGDYLESGRRDKLQKYSRLLPGLKRRFGATSGAVIPVVIGTRGGVPRSTVEDLREIGIADRSVILTMSLIALRSSLEIYSSFMDYDAVRPPRGAALE